MLFVAVGHSRSVRVLLLSFLYKVVRMYSMFCLENAATLTLITLGLGTTIIMFARCAFTNTPSISLRFYVEISEKEHGRAAGWRR